MTMDAFELMPRKLGWKHEYWDGQAHISPRWQTVTVSCSVQPRSVSSPCPLRPIMESDEPQLVAAYIAAFSDSFDFCDWQPEKIISAAKDDVRQILSGQRGRLLPASRVAIAKNNIVGAALITKKEGQPPLLDILLVIPHWHRKGVATALVAAAHNELDAFGVKTLESRYLLGNEESRAWHGKFGFTEEPDLLLAQLYYHHAKHELWRREKIRGLHGEERERLIAERERWRARVEELEALAQELGFEAVSPILRR